MKSLILCVCLFALTACSTLDAINPQPTITLADNLIVTMETTRCPSWSSCPVYRLTIYGTGQVIFEGKGNTAVNGIVSSTITKEKLEDLVIAFNHVRFFSFENYDCSPRFPPNPCPTDQPSTITSITVGDKSKTVKHYNGDPSAPAELIQLEKMIYDIVDLAQWVRGKYY